MNDVPTIENNETTAATDARGSNLMWASAFVLLGLIVLQVQGLAQIQGGSAAHAGMVAQTGPLTALTADAGGGEDLLLVLEGRSEELIVYRTDRNGTLLHQRLPIPKLFEDARAMNQGK